MLPRTMLALVADPRAHRLCLVTRPVPLPRAHQVLLRVRACGVCRTDLHVIDGDLPTHRSGVIPGHEVVGKVLAHGTGGGRFAPGQRVGVPWLGGTCGHCGYCTAQKENLCDTPLFTGYDIDGGFAEYTVADERFCLALPDTFDDAHAAPLLCAGLIGFRAWRMAGADAPRTIGLYGFGAAAHILCQLAVARGQQVFAFTRTGDTQGQAFAHTLGAVWAGACTEAPPEPLDAALIFAPAGELVPAALRAVRKGGRVVCAGIHMSTIPAFDYSLLWGERVLQSVANLTREDGEAFFAEVARMPLRTHVQTFALRDADQAVQALREGRVQGAAVLLP